MKFSTSSIVRGTVADSDPLLMMRPPRGTCVRIRRNAARVHRKAPVRLTCSVLIQSSRVIFSAGALRVLPALATTMSKGPRAVCARA